jgi:hypothetical protein
MQEASNWIIEETKSANFGDKRLNKRYGDLLNSLSNAPNNSIPASFKSWSETLAAYRFFNHKKITHYDILAPHQSATLERIKRERIVLIPQDTTEIDFSGRQPITGMGYLSTENTHGFYLHPGLAITPERSCLGVIHMQTWTREKIGIRHERNKKSIEQKESHCWLKGYEAANAVALASPETMIVSIADREGDIYELLEKMPSEKNKAYWLIRSQHNRGLLDEAGKKLESHLWEAVKASEVVGEMEFNMPDGKIYNRQRTERQPRQERTVRQEIRTCAAHIRPPKGKGKGLPPIAINIVHCVEVDPPTEEEKIEWLLITSVPIDTAEKALEVVEWYLCRWQIELFFKILKSGCTVEELQFDTLDATTNCVAFYLVIAWRILYLTMLGRNCPDIDCDAVFEESEWKSVYSIVTKKIPPKKPPKLNEVIIMIAKLGGFLARKSDGHPGSKVMWIGMQRMKDFTLAWETFGYEKEAKSCV